MNGLEQDWPSNYFNYFTEIEEHFRRARGTGLFLLSPLDWALIETWKNSGIPLPAVLRGIDLAFDKWRSRKSRIQSINGVAYCAQAVLAEAQLLANGTPSASASSTDAPFTIEELRQYLRENGAKLQSRTEPWCAETAAQLENLAQTAESLFADLEDLERQLTTLEEKLAAHARTAISDEQMLNFRRDLDAELRPYRSKMTAPQLGLLEKQYLERWIFQWANIPRLSLFYLAPGLA